MTRMQGGTGDREKSRARSARWRMARSNAKDVGYVNPWGKLERQSQ
jgi:hypothetical protein